MRRKLFTLCSALSLIMSVGAGLAWLESSHWPKSWTGADGSKYQWTDGVFAHHDGTGSFHVYVRNLILPLLILPAVWLWRRLRKQHPPGHCPACGYDMRATPCRCPECGREPAKPATA